MALYNEKTDINLDKFDIYNQYRDQICYIKVNQNLFDVIIDPDDWQELEEIVKNENKQAKIEAVKEWFRKVSPDKYGPGKEFEFTNSLIEIIIEGLKDKF